MKIGLFKNLESAPELINDRWQIGVVAMLVFGTVPFFLLLFSTFFQSENLENLSQLARTLGASERQIARRVVAPIIIKKALPNLVLSFIVVFGAYEVPLLLGRQSPQMISVFIAQKFRKFNLLDLPQAYVAAVVYAAVVFALALFFLKKQSKNSSKRMKKAALALLLAALALPFAYLLTLALAENWPFPSVLPTAFSLENLRQILSEHSRLAPAFFRSAGIGLAVAGLPVVAGFWCASRLAYHPKRAIFQSLAWLPYSFSPVIYAFCLAFFFNKSNLAGTVGGVVTAQFIVVFPFCFLLFFNHFDQKILDFEQLTATLGGSRRQFFWKVLLPVSRPVLLVGFFQAFLISWFEYGLTTVIGLGQVRTLTVAVYQFIGESNAYFAALASCLLTFPPLVLLWLNQKFVFRPR